MYFNESIECASRDEIRAIQSERLIDTVKRCYENVPFYKDAFDKAGIKPEDIKSVDDLSKLPFTNKTDLRDNYPYGLLAVPLSDVARIHASSGTTGKKTVVGYTKRDIDAWGTCTARAIVAAGGTKEDFLHVSYGYGLFTGGLGLHEGGVKLGCAIIPVSSGNTIGQVNILQDFGSDIIGCTPSYAMTIAEEVKRQGIDPQTLKLRIGIFGAEPWTNEMRRDIEKGLGIKAYDIYGLSEVMGPGVSFECSEQTGMHVNEDMFIPEIINPDTGEVLPYGEIGELVFTCIYKEALPLIRYRTHDLCRLSIDKCSCGRTFVKMTKILGRSDDMLIIRGVNVFPSQVETVLMQLGMSSNYMLIVDRKDNKDTFEIQVEINPDNFSDKVVSLEELRKKISDSVHTILGLHAKITLVETNTLPRFEGKAKRVIDNRKLVD